MTITGGLFIGRSTQFNVENDVDSDVDSNASAFMDI